MFVCGKITADANLFIWSIIIVAVNCSVVHSKFWHGVYVILTYSIARPIDYDMFDDDHTNVLYTTFLEMPYSKFTFIKI